MMRFARWVCLTIGVVGIAVFLGAFYLLNNAPEKFRDLAEAFAIEKVQEKFGQFLPPPSEGDGTIQSQITGAAQNFLQDRIEATDQFLESGGPALIANILHESGVTSCGCQTDARESVAKYITILSEEAKAKMVDLKANVVAHYETVQSKLLADFRIFILTNLAAFALVTMLAVFRGVAARYVLPIAVLLSIAILFTAQWYLFQQNWFFTILFNDYWGYSYVVTMGVVFAFLIDIALNRCRITSAILNALTHIPAAPC